MCERDGIGYKIILPEQVALAMHGQIELYTHEVIREDSHELFGFRAISELELFWKLLAVSGVGPRLAQKIVFAAPVERIKACIADGDIAFLTQMPGIGKKTAQKIILHCPVL